MSTNPEEKGFVFEIVKTIWDGRKFLLITNLLILIITIIVLLILPNEFKASSLVALRDDQNNTQIPSLLKELPIGLSSIMGGGNVLAIESLMQYTYSRTILDTLDKQLDLENYYKVRYKDDLYKILKRDLRISDNEDGTFGISYIHKDPKIAERAVAIVFENLSKLIISIEAEQAKQYREFLEKRLKECSVNLERSEENLKKYSEKTGIFNIEEQMAGQVNVLTDLEQNKIQAELQYDLLRSNLENTNALVQNAKAKVDIMQDKINDYYLKSDYSNVPISQIPEQSLNYLRLFREEKINEAILEILIPQLEKAKLDEKKDYVALITIDPPKASEKKFRPRRTNILILIQGITFFFSLLICRGWLKYKSVYPQIREYIKK